MFQVGSGVERKVHQSKKMRQGDPRSSKLDCEETKETSEHRSRRYVETRRIDRGGDEGVRRKTGKRSARQFDGLMSRSWADLKGHGGIEGRLAVEQAIEEVSWFQH